MALFQGRVVENTCGNGHFIIGWVARACVVDFGELIKPPKHDRCQDGCKGTEAAGILDDAIVLSVGE